MPLYEYRATTEQCCEFCKDGFEYWQQMTTEPVTECPICDTPVARVPALFSVGAGDVLAASNVKSHGFSRYRRTDKGSYIQE